MYKRAVKFRLDAPMPLHFLHTAAARTLSVRKVARLTEEEGEDLMRQIRWADNDGEPYCPDCGCVALYRYKSRKIWKCKACDRQFSLTSGTIFASRKLAIRDYLLAIALFCNGAKGISALQLGRDLGCSYKTAFVFAHKLREAMAPADDARTVQGVVEVDGAYFGGFVKQTNYTKNRRDRRLAENQNGKRQCVVVMRERNGKVLPFVVPTEDAAVPTVQQSVTRGSTVHADEGPHWDKLHAHFKTERITHGDAFSDEGACINMAEAFFSRMRRSEIGVHHHLAGPYLADYSNESAWRENYRRVSNGRQFHMLTSRGVAMPPSPRWAGYWQRHLPEKAGKSPSAEG